MFCAVYIQNQTQNKLPGHHLRHVLYHYLVKRLSFVCFFLLVADFKCDLNAYIKRLEDYKSLLLNAIRAFLNLHFLSDKQMTQSFKLDEMWSKNKNHNATHPILRTTEELLDNLYIEGHIHKKTEMNRKQEDMAVGHRRGDGQMRLCLKSDG